MKQMTGSAPFSYISSHASHAGCIRNINEDNLLDRSDLGIWAVADGMGGHQAGDFASRTVVDALSSGPVPRNTGEAVNEVKQRLYLANRLLRAEAAARSKGTVGATIVALVASGAACAVLWAGDSRAYLARRGSLRQLSVDHSLVQDMVANGHLTPEGAMDHPLANVITRAVGGDEKLLVDAQILRISHSDRILLCSDGLTGELTEREILSTLLCTDIQEISSTLVRRACDKAGKDNVTAVVVDFFDRKNAVL